MSKKKIVISEFDNIAALFEDDKAIEFVIHRGDMLLGDVYLATVENILPSIDAAFVNVGGDKMGFLHSSDVPGKGDLKTRLEPKQQLVVQVMKEPTGHKGPRVTTNISLPGRFLVMMPESKGISISRKIQDPKERARLKSQVSLMKPPGVGVIIRTEANEQKESDIQEDFETLIERWQNIVSMADTAKPPTLLYRDQDLLYRVIREVVSEDVTELIVDSSFGQQRAQQLLQNWNMDKGIKVTQYTGNQPILVGTGVDREVKQALQTKVPLPSGGYLYIQPTEALVVIDVNSGKFTSLASQAETIKLTNLEACREIARQLRLRNIGGMIIVDFIDMESRADQLKVLETFENELSTDKGKPQIGQLSDLGLVEMTRHRQGQALSEIFTRRCTGCGGTGHAVDEHIWAHGSASGEGEGRHRRDRQQERSKLPMKQGRHQQVAKLPPNVKTGGTKPGLNLLAEFRANEKQQQPQKQPAEATAPQPMPLKSGERREQLPQDGSALADYLDEKLFKHMGIRLANVAKLAYAPPIANSILTRINPKANDVLTLVNTIVAMPHGHHFEEEGGEDAEASGLEDRPRGYGRYQHPYGGQPQEQAQFQRARAGTAVRDFESDEAEEGLAEEAVEQLRWVEPEEADVDAVQEAAVVLVAEAPEAAIEVEVEDIEPEAIEKEVEKPKRGRPSRRVEPEPDEIELTVVEPVDDEDAAEAEDSEDATEENPSAGAAKAAQRRRGRPPKRSTKKH